MRSFSRLAVLALPLLGRVACEEAASPTRKSENSPKPVYANAHEAFQDLLNALPEESLHVALNSLTHFKDGIFESDRQGVERVHHDNAPLATKLIVAAVQDLKKRQTPPSNGTTSSAPPPPESTSQAPPPESSEAPPPASSEAPPPASSEAPAPQSSAVVVPVPIATTTDSEGQTVVVSSEILSQPTASVAVAVTRTNAQGETEVTTETKPAVIFTATDTAGSAFLTTSAVDFAPTPGQVLTKTDSRGSTFFTTYTPGGGKVSSILLITTTGANGEPMVITSYTFVDPAQATATDANGNPAQTNTGKPGLQTGAANRNWAADAALVGGAVGGAFAFLI
ncbi:hypothetical protein BU26DRAFT_251856 [Trematosphaeria pertusa]|uniref:Uncharacterized protein n=1 Tax=Trematosphaeria pertusa TaxID=390896 RepID=A0A6A6IP12_9PLEO|nr:uncharacterized protein BU26DRAFT_251856 [Trematosphaeria pertusa]KAF2252136.1 hypothetical protein BU26DRAFT_251856 [Trematosphaeria pertusa]